MSASLRGAARAWAEPVDGASLDVARRVVGAMLALVAGRWLARGQVDSLWLDPAHRFHYPGLWWVGPLPAPWLHLVVATLAALGLVVAVGPRRTPRRAALAAGTLLLGYLEAIDVTVYLNHHWLLLLLGTLLAVLPRADEVPRWALWSARALVGAVYMWAAVAKVDPDWLRRGQPVHSWLAVHSDWPLLGRWVVRRDVARAAAVASFAFDATIVPLLAWRRSRPAALGLVVVFHVATALSFPIGVFPYLMIGLASLWCSPSWPRRLPLPALPPVPTRTSARAWRPALAAVLVGIAVLAPVRALVARDTAWSEQGGRFSWRVLAADKVGVVEAVVRDTVTDERWLVRPDRDLTRFQATQMSWQPDLILQWAHLVARLERERTGHRVEVRVEDYVSLNARPPAVFVDPTVDLAEERWTWTRPSWVEAAPRR